MAEAYACLPALSGLRGSATRPAGGSQRLVEELRAELKARTRAGWSREAVRRGVALARAGQEQAAARCYAQALELDARNADAWVARGAAAANAGDLRQAVAHLTTALDICPDDANAAKYLAVVRQRLHQQGGAASHDTPPASEQPAGSAHVSQQATPAPQLGRSAQRAGAPLGSAARSSPPSSSSLSSPASLPGAGAADGRMDLATALKIVSKHYASRNASFPHQYTRCPLAFQDWLAPVLCRSMCKPAVTTSSNPVVQ